MADKKISALPAATTPLAGTEVLPIVQGGTTDQVSVANLTAGRAVSAASLTATGAISGATVATTGIASVGTSFGVGRTPTEKVDFYGTTSHEKFIVDLSQGGASASYSELRFKFSTVEILTWGGGNTALADKTTLAGPSSLALKTGTTDKITISNAGNVTANVGNFILGTAGKGIDFSANTHAPGMTSELLNWYETGTFTPVAADAETGGNVAASAIARGVYTRIGNVVTVNFEIYSINTTGMTAGNTLYLRGLPFVNNASQYANGVVDMRNTAFTDYPTVFLGKSSSAIMLFMHTSGAGVSQILVSNVTVASIFFVSLTYTV